jgi:hypothetical protein
LILKDRKKIFAEREEELPETGESSPPTTKRNGRPLFWTENEHTAYNWYAQPNRVEFIHEQWANKTKKRLAEQVCQKIHQASLHDLGEEPVPDYLKPILKNYCQVYLTKQMDCINTEAPFRRENLCSHHVFQAKAFDKDFNRTFIGYFPNWVKPGTETKFEDAFLYYWCFSFDKNYYFPPKDERWLWGYQRSPIRNTIAIHLCFNQRESLEIDENGREIEESIFSKIFNWIFQ